MKQNTLQIITAAAFALAAGSAVVVAQSKTGAADAHVAAAKAAAGQDHLFMFNQLCAPPAAPAPAVAAPAAPQPSPPDRSQWHVEPVKVFDNLYFVGQSEFSAWAVKTSAGIILVDTIFDYSVEDEVVGGRKKLGLDPAQIRFDRRLGSGPRIGPWNVEAGEYVAAQAFECACLEEDLTRGN